MEHIKIITFFLPFAVLGFFAPMPIALTVAAIYDKADPLIIGPIVLAFLVIVLFGHWLAFLAIRRVYRWPPEEVWMGYSRIVWLTVVPCAYFLGLAGCVFGVLTD